MAARDATIRICHWHLLALCLKMAVGKNIGAELVWKNN
jgi:hypothetical protein